MITEATEAIVWVFKHLQADKESKLSVLSSWSDSISENPCLMQSILQSEVKKLITKEQWEAVYTPVIYK